MLSPDELKALNLAFIDALHHTLKSRSLFPGVGPLQKPALLGKGATGLVLRGYVLEQRGGAQRLRWVVVKAPRIRLPRESEDDGGSSPPPAPFADDCLLHELEQRTRIGDVTGLVAVPRAVEWPLRPVLNAMKGPIHHVDYQREAISLLVFELSDEHVAHAPPEELGAFVHQAVTTAPDLVSWCEIAMRLGQTLMALHRRGFGHRDVKLGNVVAQQENGRLRAIELIDLGHAEQVCLDGVYGRRVYAEDVGTRQYWRPERLKAMDDGVKFVQRSAFDEDIYAYGSLLARVLLGRLPAKHDASGAGTRPHPDQPFAKDVEKALEAAKVDNSEPTETVAQEIATACALVHGLLVDHHDGSPERLGLFVREVERIRNEAYRAMPAGRLRTLVSALDQYASADQKRQWQERYVSEDLAVALSDAHLLPGAPSTVDNAVDLLRNGYIGVAREMLRKLLLRGPRGVEHDAEDARTLRMYLGQILLRERREVEAREILAKFQAGLDPGAPKTGCVWWVRMLAARFDLLAHRKPSLADLDIDPLDGRQRVWLLALRVQDALRRKLPVAPADVTALGNVRLSSSVSTSELIFVSLLLARIRAKAGGLFEAMHVLADAAGQAAMRGFPVEHAIVLVDAADVMLHSGDRAKLAHDGEDVDALLERLQELSLKSAELLHKMRVDPERDRALHMAGQCAAARLGQGAGERRAAITDAARLLELSDANARLDGRESEVRRDKLAALRDPGTSGAQPRYEQHEKELTRMWGAAGMTVELAQEGAALDALLADPPLDPAPKQILVVGCGRGEDVRRLAERYPEAHVHGVDAFSLNIAASTSLAQGSPVRARCSFHLVDLIQRGPLVDEDQGHVGPWDLVVMRETLADVTLERRFLMVLRRHMRPGDRLRLTDLVQCKPSGPASWRALLSRLGVPNLASRQGLLDDLGAACFEVQKEALSGAEPIVDFLMREREALDDEEAPPSVLEGTRELFDKLIKSMKEGKIGWLRVSAVAVGDDPPDPDLLPETLGLSSYPPPGTVPPERG